VLADTVGFIRHLPHKLVQAFKATLQETAEADLLLHVIDSADENRTENMAEVEAVLAEIGSDDIRRLEVFNKIDLLNDFAPAIERDDQGRPVRVWVSAQKGEGLALIQQAIGELLGDEVIAQKLAVKPSESAFRAALYAQNAVLAEDYDESGMIWLDIRIQKKDLRQLVKRNGIAEDRFGLAEPKPFYEH
jgi:GTP-binding protein HflX